MDVRYVPLFVAGLLGGGVAYLVGTPLPFLLGSFVGTGIYVLHYERAGRSLPKVSRWVRLIFISTIGAMIGARFTPELAALLPHFWVSILALLPFILIAHTGGYAIMRNQNKR